MKNSKKKKMPLLLKIFLIIIGLIAALILAGFVWLRVNQEKILNNMLESASQFDRTESRSHRIRSLKTKNWLQSFFTPHGADHAKKNSLRWMQYIRNIRIK